MSSNQAYSRPERLVNGASWAIAVVFALFLNMLGALVIRDLELAPAGAPLTEAEFVSVKVHPLAERQMELSTQAAAAAMDLRDATARYDAASAGYARMREGFKNWTAARSVTGNSAIDPELTERTRALDASLANLNSLGSQRDALAAKLDSLQARRVQADSALATAQAKAADQYQHEKSRSDLRVFGYRLALTLPVLVLAVWLFVRFRKARYWAFVYGFGFFALSAFFVELVPYLPSFGGYVRAGVGIGLTVFAGVYLLRAFQRYAQRKGEEMQRTQAERSGKIAYEKALRALERKLCPSCDHPTPATENGASFCVHCGLKLFSVCSCGHRNFAFYRHCNACGAPGANAESAAQAGVQG